MHWLAWGSFFWTVCYGTLIFVMLYLCILATSHFIRPTTLFFGMLPQCDIERADFLIFFYISIFDDFRASFHFLTYIWSLHFTVFGIWTNYLCLKGSHNTRKKKVLKKFRTFWKLTVLGAFFCFFLLYLCICHRSPHWHTNLYSLKKFCYTLHSGRPFNEKSMPGKNKDIQVYIRMSTKTGIILRMVTLMSN